MLDKKNINVKNYDILAILFFFVTISFLISLFLMHTIWYANFEKSGMIYTLLKYVRYLAYFLSLILIFFKEKGISDHLFSVIILTTFGLSMVLSHNNTFFLYGLIICSTIGFNRSKILSQSLVIQLSLLVLTLGLSVFGVVDDYIFDLVRNRHGLGFSWTTTAPIMFFFIILQIVYYYENRLEYYFYVLMEAICISLYMLTNTRMTFILSSIFILLVFLLRVFSPDNKISIPPRAKIIITITPIVICCLAIIMPFLYNPSNQLIATINKIMSGRLMYGQNALRTYGLSLFGQEVEWVGYGIGAKEGVYNYVDSSYLRIAIQNGIIPLLVVLSIYCKMLKEASDQNNIIVIITILFVLLLCFTEPRLFDFAFNPFPLLSLSSSQSQLRQFDEHSKVSTFSVFQIIKKLFIR